MTTLIKFTGKEKTFQCVDNMKNELLKDWILDNADQILKEKEVREQYEGNQKFFEWNISTKSRIKEEDKEVEELINIFAYKDYEDIKENTVNYNRFVWANLHDIKECFEDKDIKEILKECI